MPTPGFGLLVLDERVRTSSIAAKGSGTYESEFTEAGPEPGHPVLATPDSTWRPRVVGAQEQDLEIRTVRGGFAGRWKAGVAYRLGDETSDDDWRGWDEPNLPALWTSTSALFGSSVTWDRFTSAVPLPDERVLVLSNRSSTNDGFCHIYDPRNETWVEAFDWGAGTSALANPVGMAVDPNTAGRVILWQGAGLAASAKFDTNRSWIAWYSDDNGSSWDFYSRGMFPVSGSGTNGSTLHVAPKRDADWLCIMYGDLGGAGTSVARQFASSDRGVTFDLIVDTADMSGTQHMCAPTRTGFVVAYVNSTGRPCVRLLPTARSPFDGATEQVIDAGAAGVAYAGRILVTTDADGIIYIVTRGTGAQTTRDHTRMYYSLDDGASWGRYQFDAMAGADGVQWDWTSFVAAGGQLHAFGGRLGSTSNTADTLGLMSFGGWSNVESGTGDQEWARDRSERCGYGLDSAGGGDGRCWFPIDLPDNMGWFPSGAGTATQTPSGEVALELDTGGSGTGIQYSNLSTPGARSQECGHVTLKVDADSHTLAAVGLASTGTSMSLGASDGANNWTLVVDIGTDGVQMRDTAAPAIRATALFDTTAQYFHIRATASEGKATAWYRLEGADKWILIGKDVTITAAAGTGVGMTWGHAAGQGGHGYWRFAGYSAGGDFRSGVEDVTDPFATSEDRVLALGFGKSAPRAGDRYPLPWATPGTSSDVGYLEAGGGHTFMTEEVSLPVAYVNGIDQVGPLDSPRPARQWKSADDSKVELVWGLGADTVIGNVIGVVILQAWPRRFDVRIDDGAGGWTALGEVDKGWSNLTYQRDGDMIRPGATTAIDRYFHEGELVGGYFVLSNGVVLEIVHNSAGYWSNRSGIQQLVLRTVTNASANASGSTGQLVHHSAVALFETGSSTPIARRYLGINIDAGQATPDSTYRAGVLGLGQVVGVGADPSWGWTRSVQLTRELVRRADAMLQVRRTGPPRRRLTYDWPDGVIVRDMRLEADAPDAVAYPTGGNPLPMGTEEDVHSRLMGVVEHLMRSGEMPCVVIPRLPDRGIPGGGGQDPAVITDPWLYLYGRLLSDSQGVVGITGNEDDDPVVRVDGLTFEELR